MTRRIRVDEFHTPNDLDTTYEGWQLAMLIQIRNELRKLNALLHCHNTVDIPRKLERIARHTARIKAKLEEPEAQ